MSLQACADLVQRGDPDRHLAIMTAPVAARRVLFPLYAFNVEVSRAPWVTQEPTIAEMRLQWWRDALDEIAGGGAVRKHEVVGPLASVLDKDAAILLDNLVLARRWDIYREPFGESAEFEDYIARSSADLMWVAARALGLKRRDPAREMGMASGIAGFLRAIPALEAHGRIPLDDAEPEAVRAIADKGIAHLKAARAVWSEVPVSARPALRTGWQAGYILGRASQQPSRVRDGRISPSPLRARGALIWRTLSGQL